MANELERVRKREISLNPSVPSVPTDEQTLNQIKTAPNRALDPRRSIGSGPSMAPKFGKNLDPGFKGPGSLPPTPKDNVDPGFGRKTMPATPGIQNMPYKPGTGGGIKTMPYTPPKDGSGPKIENMPFIKPESPKLKPAKPFLIPQKKMKRDMP